MPVEMIATTNAIPSSGTMFLFIAKAFSLEPPTAPGAPTTSTAVFDASSIEVCPKGLALITLARYTADGAWSCNHVATGHIQPVGQVKENDMLKQLKGFLAPIAVLILPLAPAIAAGSAVPGGLNYVEGQVTVAGQPVTSRSVGLVQLEPDQVLQTGRGRAELLLTPGVFLRLGDNSSVRLI